MLAFASQGLPSRYTPEFVAQLTDLVPKHNIEGWTLQLYWQLNRIAL